MNEFFFDLVKYNWGITFHFIISLVLIQICYIVIPRKYEGYFIAGVFSLGGLYEVYQAIVESPKSGEFIQDMIANLLGLGVGVLLSLLMLRK